jgi:hypothetical protein
VADSCRERAAVPQGHVQIRWTSKATATITLSSPAAVIAALPRLVGYIRRAQAAVVAVAGVRVGFVSVASADPQGWEPGPSKP